VTHDDASLAENDTSFAFDDGPPRESPRYARLSAS
jgi:hypothetical protein